jgi:F0F1-type ATP synthase assembly protein I
LNREPDLREIAKWAAIPVSVAVMLNKRIQHFRKNPKNLNDYARYSGIVFQMAILIGAGTFGGRKLDEWLTSGFPIFTIVLSILGVGLALYIVLRDLSNPTK